MRAAILEGVFGEPAFQDVEHFEAACRRLGEVGAEALEFVGLVA